MLGPPALLFYYSLQLYGRVEDGELPGAVNSVWVPGENSPFHR